MRYPLPEKIGDPDLLVGREKEFALLNRWLDGIPRRISKSRVILARRKSGKTAIVQRIFNRLWNENGLIVPFYLSIPETKAWYPEFGIRYYRTFASHYISFLERDERPVNAPLSLDEIREYGMTNGITALARDADMIRDFKEDGLHFMLWETAYTAPERFATEFDRRVLVILDEFQNITQYIYPDEKFETSPIETLAGSFHDVVESKIAPMLVTGSYVGWLIQVTDKYLEAGRLKRHFMPPYLTPEEGLQAVYKYAEVLDVPVTNETAAQIARLCMADPFFISCVIQSEYEGKDLTTQEGVADTVTYEITDKSSEMSMAWGEYIELTLEKINDRHAKAMLLFLSRNADRVWTPEELKKELNLEIGEKEIQKKLEIMAKADVIAKGVADIDYKGLRDGTLNLILRSRFEKEISRSAPDLKKEFAEELGRLKKDRKSLQGKLNNMTGKFAEFQLFTEFRARKRFSLSEYFEGVTDKTELNITEARMRFRFHLPDGKEREIDVTAESDCGRTILAEVKKTAEKTGLPAVKIFHEKTGRFAQCFPEKKILPVFLSAGGFTPDALKFCEEKGIGTAERIAFFQAG